MSSPIGPPTPSLGSATGILGVRGTVNSPQLPGSFAPTDGGRTQHISPELAYISRLRAADDILRIIALETFLGSGAIRTQSDSMFDDPITRRLEEYDQLTTVFSRQVLREESKDATPKKSAWSVKTSPATKTQLKIFGTYGR